jgi:hypothetical protein
MTLERRTPLTRKTALRSSGPPKRKTPPARTAMPRRSPNGPTRANRGRSKGFTPATRRAIFERDGWTCQARHVWPHVRCDGRLHAHHVKVKGRRGAPDNSTANGLTLCAVHHDHAHNVDRAGAERAGIIRRSL